MFHASIYIWSISESKFFPCQEAASKLKSGICSSLSSWYVEVNSLSYDYVLANMIVLKAISEYCSG